MKTNQSQKNIPEGWKETKLADIGVFSKGSGITKDQLTKTGHNAIRYGELYTKFNFKIEKIYSHIPTEVIPTATKIKYGDILFAGSGETNEEIGKSAAYLLSQDCYAGGDLIIFTPKNADSLFLSYSLNIGEGRKKLTELGQGQSVVHIYKSEIEKLKLHLPPVSEQKRIVSVIETWDKSIEKLVSKINVKKQLKISLMQGLLTGKVRLPGFADRWKIVNLGDLLKERNERDVESEKLLLYSLTIENGVCPKGERYDRSFLVKSDSKVYKKTYKNDIVYNPANLRYGAIAHNKNENPVLLSPIYQVLFVKDEKETNIDFIGQLLTWERQIRKMSAYAEGTLIERMEVKIDSFKTIQIDIPDKKEQDAIANILNTASKEIFLLEEKLSFIQEQKRYLLNNLITGTIRTPETLSTKLTK
jgi:type I restriction enzyme S subunit